MSGKINTKTPYADGSNVTVRMAENRDTRTLVRLGALDSGPVPEGPALVAEIDGDAVAALPLDGGRPLADPFRQTSAMIELLELRAAQLRAEGQPSPPRGSYAERLRALVRAPRTAPQR